MQTYKDATPYVQGAFAAQPLYLILHGSRSGRLKHPQTGADWTTKDEFDSTRRYCVTNPDGLAWHATIGDEEYSVHMSPRNWGYHIREESRLAIGVEFAQAVEAIDIHEAQVNAFCDWYKSYVVPAWPGFNIAADGVMWAHSERPPGMRDGKSDVYRPSDERLQQLKNAIITKLGGAGQEGTGGSKPVPVDPANAAFTDYVKSQPKAVRDAWGDPLYRGDLSGREGWGAKSIPFVRLERAALAYIQGKVVNVTGRALDDWETQNAKYIQRY